MEIDILEVLPGTYGPNYKKEKVDTGICQPQSELLYRKLDMPRPHLRLAISYIYICVCF